VDLQTCLTVLRRDILHDRTDRASGSEDLLWSDDCLIRYINEAERRFARLSLCIRDGRTPEATQITLVDGVTEYDLHPSVLGVISGRLENEVADMARASHSLLDTYQPEVPTYFDTNQLSLALPGKPIAFTTDEGVGLDEDGSLSTVTLRVYPEPSADYDGLVVQLRVIRLPIYDLTEGDLAATPEIPSIHHLEFLDYAASLALRIVDSDAGSPARAREFEESFERHVSRARRAVLRKLRPKAAFQFGRHGFSWS
jgi:hypothetical protein